MEEAGHYYTVYLTSLAVGFAEDIAYKHAVLAQMPDEVGYLDAANLHIKYCKMISKEKDLSGNSIRPPNDWRFIVEVALHSLTGGSSANQRLKTATFLMSKNIKADSLEFGLLLHRLGDTFAHSMMKDESVLYKVSYEYECSLDTIGHGLDGHDPDYPFLRQDLFYSYLLQLYTVMNSKINEKQSSIFKRGNNSNSPSISYQDLKDKFEYIFQKSKVSIALKILKNKHTVQNFMIDELRKASKALFGIRLKDYQPENDEAMDLNQFMQKHPEVKSMITKEKIISSLQSISDELFGESYIEKLQKAKELKDKEFADMRRQSARDRMNKY